MAITGLGSGAGDGTTRELPPDRLREAGSQDGGGATRELRGRARPGFPPHRRARTPPKQRARTSAPKRRGRASRDASRPVLPGEDQRFQLPVREIAGVVRQLVRELLLLAVREVLRPRKCGDHLGAGIHDRLRLGAARALTARGRVRGGLLRDTAGVLQRFRHLHLSTPRSAVLFGSIQCFRQVCSACVQKQGRPRA